MPTSWLVPNDATVFHRRHGLGAAIDWLDLLTECRDGLRSILPKNTQRLQTGMLTERVQTFADNRARLYTEDFGRFGYDPAERQPMSPPPQLSGAFARRQQHALHLAHTPPGGLQRKVLRHLHRL